MPEFPHMDANTDFPFAKNVDVYKYNNEYDYVEFDYTQMTIKVCAVPWDVGQAHVGNRTIDGIGNVVSFEDKDARDDYIWGLDGIEWETKYRNLHTDKEIIVPVPFDMCIEYNYLAVEYEVLPNAKNPVEYENPTSGTGMRRWYWFIRSVEALAPNSTKLHLLMDAWQNFIYDVDVTGAMLERGHAPMFDISASTYLNAPYSNCKLLKTPDVAAENLATVVHVDNSEVFNNGASMYAVFVSDGYLETPYTNWKDSDGDSFTPSVPVARRVNGNPSPAFYAIPTGDFASFCADMNDDYPQFIQTIRGIFFAPAKFITLGNSFTFAGHTVYTVSSSPVYSTTLITLSKSDFGIPSNYANIAKLYTYPYSWLEVNDEQGRKSILYVEDCTSDSLLLYAGLSLAFPAISYTASLHGLSSEDSRSYTFKNVDTLSYTAVGAWYDTVRSWDVPVFSVRQGMTTFDRHVAHVYDYVQAAYDANTKYNATDYTATGLHTTTDNKALSDRTLAINMSEANYDNDTNTRWNIAEKFNNTYLGGWNEPYGSSSQYYAGSPISVGDCYTSSGETIYAYGRTLNATDYMCRDFDLATYKTFNDWSYDKTYMLAINTAQASANGSTNINNAVGGTVSSAFGGAVSGGAAGGAGGALAGAGIGLASGVISGVTMSVNTSIAIDTAWASMVASESQESSKTRLAILHGLEKVKLECDYHDVDTAINLETVRRHGDLYYDTTNASITNGGVFARNAYKDWDTITDNSQTTYDATMAAALEVKNNDLQHITSNKKQAAIMTPKEFGITANTGGSDIVPQVIVGSICRQDDSSIAYAGDAMLRYGYMLEQYYRIDNDWCRGKYFTYWKLSDMQVSGLTLSDEYMDMLRFFLYGGVTVWSDPDEIGNRTIYENWPD